MHLKKTCDILLIYEYYKFTKLVITNYWVREKIAYGLEVSFGYQTLNAFLFCFTFRVSKEGGVVRYVT